jgi:hypothetical protein
MKLRQFGGARDAALCRSPNAAGTEIFVEMVSSACYAIESTRFASKTEGGYGDGRLASRLKGQTMDHDQSGPATALLGFHIPS